MELFGYSIVEILTRLLLGLATGFCIGLTGVGGAILVMPTLTLLGYDSITAVGTTSLYAFLTRVSATFHHIKLKTIDWKLALQFLAGSIPANILVSLWISRQGADLFFEDKLTEVITGVIIVAALAMTLNLIIKTQKKLLAKDQQFTHFLTKHPALRATTTLLLGGLCGSFIGATSIGGGVLIVPILMVVFGLSASRTVGTAIFIAFILTFSTALIYGYCGEQDRITAIIMAVGALAGVRYGSRLSVKMPEFLLRSLVIALTLIAAIMMLYDQTG